MARFVANSTSRSSTNDSCVAETVEVFADPRQRRPEVRIGLSKHPEDLTLLVRWIGFQHLALSDLARPCVRRRSA